MTRINQVINRLWRLLREHPELAELENQTHMLFMYWKTYDIIQHMSGTDIYYVKRDLLNHLTSFESISRARRKLIETGRVKVSDESQRASDRLEEEYRRDMVADM